MNCPQCSNQILFGTAKCACGYFPGTEAKQADDRSVELSYFEALRAFWRIYWPMQLLAAPCLFISTDFLTGALVILTAKGVGLYVTIGSLVFRPFRGFLIIVQSITTREVSRRVTARQRLDAWAYLYWRLVVAEVLAFMLTAPLNMILSVMGFNVKGWMTTAGFLLVCGPILLKMLIGENFNDFVLIVRRRGEVPVELEAPVPATPSGEPV